MTTCSELVAKRLTYTPRYITLLTLFCLQLRLMPPHQQQEPQRLIIDIATLSHLPSTRRANKPSVSTSPLTSSLCSSFPPSPPPLPIDTLLRFHRSTALYRKLCRNVTIRVYPTILPTQPPSHHTMLLFPILSAYSTRTSRHHIIFLSASPVLKKVKSAPPPYRNPSRM